MLRNPKQLPSSTWFPPLNSVACATHMCIGESEMSEAVEHYFWSVKPLQFCGVPVRVQTRLTLPDSTRVALFLGHHKS